MNPVDKKSVTSAVYGVISDEIMLNQKSRLGLFNAKRPFVGRMRALLRERWEDIESVPALVEEMFLSNLDIVMESTIYGIPKSFYEIDHPLDLVAACDTNEIVRLEDHEPTYSTHTRPLLCTMRLGTVSKLVGRNMNEVIVYNDFLPRVPVKIYDYSPTSTSKRYDCDTEGVFFPSHYVYVNRSNVISVPHPDDLQFIRDNAESPACKYCGFSHDALAYFFQHDRCILDLCCQYLKFGIMPDELIALLVIGQNKLAQRCLLNFDILYSISFMSRVHTFMPAGGVSALSKRKYVTRGEFREDFYVVDGNPERNKVKIQKMYRAFALDPNKSRYKFTIYGRTHCGNFVLPFPVYVHANTAYDHLSVIESLDRKERAMLDYGYISREVAEKFKPFFAPILNSFVDSSIEAVVRAASYVPFRDLWYILLLCLGQFVGIFFFYAYFTYATYEQYESLIFKLAQVFVLSTIGKSSFREYFTFSFGVLSAAAAGADFSLSESLTIGSFGCCILTIQFLSLSPLTRFFVGPLIEEIFKFKVYWAIGFFEMLFSSSWYELYLRSIFFWLHILLTLIDFTVNPIAALAIRYVLHLCLNFVFTGLPMNMLMKVETLSPLCQLLYNLVRRDFENVLMTITSNYSKFVGFINTICGSFDAAFLSSIIGDDNAGIVFLSKEDEKKERSTFDYLVSLIVPKEIRSSPTFTKLKAFAVMLSTLSFVGDSWLVKTIFGWVDWEFFSNKNDLVTTVVEAGRVTLSGLKRMIETGSLGDFFEPSPDVKFKIRCDELLKYGSTVKTQDEFIARKAEIESMIQSRYYLNNDHEITSMLRQLREQKDILSKKIEACEPKEMPFPVYLEGPPGVGKTAMTNTMMSVLCKDVNMKRFEGDVIDANIYDKYPASAGLNHEATAIRWNDIASVYTDFPKNDLIPLDISLQQALDSTAFYLRDASVEKKGLVLRKLKFVFLTSNHSEYVFPGEVEKLERRLRSGFLARMEIVENGRILSEKEFSRFSHGKRNSLTVYRMLAPVVNGNHLTFVPTGVVIPHADMFTKLLEMHRSFKTYHRDINDEFNKLNCACGASDLHHCVRDSQGDLTINLTKNCTVAPIVNEPWYERNFCGDRFCNCGLLRQRHVQDGVLVNLSSQCGALPTTMNSLNLRIIIPVFITAILFLLCQNCVIPISDAFLRAFGGTRLMEAVLSSVSYRTAFIIRSRIMYLKIKDAYDKYKEFLAAATVTAVLTTLYAHMRSRGYEALADPIFARDVNPKTISYFETTPGMNFSLSKAMQWGKEREKMLEYKIVSGVSEADLGKIVKPNLETVIFSFLVNQVEVSRKVMVFGIDLTHFLINEHVLNDLPDDDMVFIRLERGLDEKNPSTRFSKQHCHRVGKSEVFIYHHVLPVFHRHVTKFLWEEIVPGPLDVSFDFGESFVPGSYVRIDNLEGKKADFDAIFARWKPVKGDCITPVLGRINGGSFLIGFIAFGLMRDGMTGATLVSRKDVFETLKVSDGLFHPPTDISVLSECVEPLADKCELRNIPSPYIMPIGTIPGPTNTFTSKIRRSRLYNDVSTPNPWLTKTFGIPERTSVVVDGVYHSPFTKFRETLTLQCNISDSEEKFAADAYVMDVLNGLPKGVKVGSLSLEDAIFGKPDLGIERIKFKTSSGPTLRKRGIRNKYDAFTQVEGGEYPYEFKEEVMDRVKDLMEAYSKQIVLVYPSEATEKDEVREQKKLDFADVRIFYNCDMATNLVGRMLSLVLITLLLNNPEVSECYGGMNAASFQWHDLYMRLDPQNRLILDMDFRCFDMSHVIRCFRAFAYICALLTLRLSGNLDLAQKVYVAVYAGAYELVKWKNDLFLKMMGLNSGRWFTLMMNSIVNSWLMRVAFIRLSLPVLRFKELVRCATVGDDNISSVSESIKDQFNLVILQKIYRGFGYICTDASKSAEVRPFIPISEATFVKRKFLVNEDTDLKVTAPLDTNSVLKALMFESKESGVSPVQRLYQVGESAQREMFLHGKSEFLLFREWLVAIFKKHRLEDFKALEYEALKQDYLEKRFVTEM